MTEQRDWDRAYAEASGDWSDYVRRYGDVDPCSTAGAHSKVVSARRRRSRSHPSKPTPSTDRKRIRKAL